jgi:hypothetical protein
MSDLLLVDMTTKQCIFHVCSAVTEAIPIIRSRKSSTATLRVYCLASGENYEGSENILSVEHTWTLHTIIALFYEFFLQIILSSTVNINKSVEYEAFVSWLGDCLFFKRGNVLWVEDCKILGLTTVLVFTLALYICVYLWIFNLVFWDLHTIFPIC